MGKGRSGGVHQRRHSNNNVRLLKFPPHFLNFLLSLNDPEFTFLFCSWNDRRLVSMLNTFLQHSMEEIPVKFPKNSTRQKPCTVVKYNETMGGVDEVDKILQPYTTSRKSLKWYKKIFFHLIDITVYNSFNIYKEVSGKKTNYKKFVLELLEELFQELDLEVKPKGRPSEIEILDTGRMSGMHFPKKPTKSNCILCYRSGKRSTTVFECERCKVHLCLGQAGQSNNCFRLYHTSLSSGL